MNEFISNHLRLILFAGIAVLIILIMAIIKPFDHGSPYDEYFAGLNKELKARGPGRPSLVLDLDRLDSNIAQIKEIIKPPMGFRLVVKSLPSAKLIRYIQSSMGSDRLMVFHGPDLKILGKSGLGNMDMLFGKPMPINAARDFYNSLRPDWNLAPSKRVQWLIDSPGRLEQYLALAREKGLLMRINIEIDVGLHRGGITRMDELDRMLKLIAANPKNLAFSGFMGYDAHVASAPAILSSKKAAIDSAFRAMYNRYSEFYAYGKKAHPELFGDGLCFNSGGSQTYRLYRDEKPINDLALGSCIVKPTDFDTGLLASHIPALFIATPVLKRIEGTTIPFLEKFSGLMSRFDPNKQNTYFIYGGGWMARFASPEGLEGNALYGFSTNQAIVNGSNRTALGADDMVFLRPTQSEVIMREFGDLLIVRGGRVIDRWPVFEE